jgi:hypothetical protein
MTITEDYRDGYKIGCIDKMNGNQSELLWYADENESQTFQDYSRGYHDGWNYGRAF